jgi:hypothetical protein
MIGLDGSTTRNVVAKFSALPVPVASYTDDYITAWAGLRALGKKSGASVMFGRALALLRREVERECKARGVDHRPYLPERIPLTGKDSPRYLDRLNALEATRRRLPQVDGVDARRGRGKGKRTT